MDLHVDNSWYSELIMEGGYHTVQQGEIPAFNQWVAYKDTCPEIHCMGYIDSRCPLKMVAKARFYEIISNVIDMVQPKGTSFIQQKISKGYGVPTAEGNNNFLIQFLVDQINYP